MVEINKAQRFFAGLDPTGGLGQIVAQADALTERGREREERRADRAEERKAKLKFAVLDNLMKGVMAGQIQRTPEIEDFIARGMEQLGGMQEFALPEVITQAQPAKDPLTRFQNRRAEVEAQLGQTDDPREQAALTRTLNEIQGRINTIAMPGEKLEYRDAGDRIVGLNAAGDIVKEIRKGRVPSTRQPSTSTVNLMLTPEQAKEFGQAKISRMADDPVVRRLINEGAVIGSKGGGISFQRGPGGELSLQVGGNVPIGAQSKGATELAQMETIQLLGERLKNALRAKDVGLPGVVGEAADVFLGVLNGMTGTEFETDPERFLNRALLKNFREASLRSVSGEDRFSNLDRIAIENMLPKDGVFESLGRAKAKIQIVQSVLRERAMIKANQLGRPRPMSAMSRQELKDLHRQATEAGDTQLKETALLYIWYLHNQ